MRKPGTRSRRLLTAKAARLVRLIDMVCFGKRWELAIMKFSLQYFFLIHPAKQPIHPRSGVDKWRWVSATFRADHLPPNRVSILLVPMNQKLNAGRQLLLHETAQPPQPIRLSPPG